MKPTLTIFLETAATIIFGYFYGQIFYSVISKYNGYNTKITLGISIASILVGFAMWIFNGLILDYGTSEEQGTYFSLIFCVFGFIILALGILTLLRLITIRLINLTNKILNKN